MLLWAPIAVGAQTAEPSWGLFYTTGVESNSVFTSNAEVPRPIASVTKLMTAWLAISADQSLSRVVSITPQDTQNASTTILRVRDRVSVRDLIYLMLVSSDNVAARAIARVVGGSREQFVRSMNHEAERLMMTHTEYSDPSGLLSTNISTVHDLVRLITVIMSSPILADAFHTPIYTATVTRNRRVRSITVKNTNRLLTNTTQISKTGFTTAAGYCLVQLITDQHDSYITIILGAPSKDYRQGVTEALMKIAGIEH